jgi:hypothetical protein
VGALAKDDDLIRDEDYVSPPSLTARSQLQPQSQARAISATSGEGSGCFFSAFSTVSKVFHFALS